MLVLTKWCNNKIGLQLNAPFPQNMPRVMDKGLRDMPSLSWVNRASMIENSKFWIIAVRYCIIFRWDWNNGPMKGRILEAMIIQCMDRKTFIAVFFPQVALLIFIKYITVIYFYNSSPDRLFWSLILYSSIFRFISTSCVYNSSENSSFLTGQIELLF